MFLFFEIDLAILVIVSDLKSSYLTNGDGSSKIAAKISAPSNDYTSEAKHAMINGRIHIFGGKNNKRKVTLYKKTSLKFKITDR